MCISCGCNDYNNSHDDERNVTIDTLREAASAGNLTIEDVLGNMRDGAATLLQEPPPGAVRQGAAVKDRLHPD